MRNKPILCLSEDDLCCNGFFCKSKINSPKICENEVRPFIKCPNLTKTSCKTKVLQTRPKRNADIKKTSTIKHKGNDKNLIQWEGS